MNARIFLQVKTVFLFIASGNAILTRNERPINEDLNLGCQWRSSILGSTLACECQPEAEVFHIREDSISSIDISAIHIGSCNRVIFDSNAIRTMRSLREVRLTGIKNLTFEESGLSWEGYVTNIDLNTPTLRVIIQNSFIDRISSYTFKGKISQITFDDVVVINMAPFAFTSLIQSQSITFSKVITDNVHPQAFKKFTTGQIEIMGSNFTLLPSRAFSEITITENFLIRNSSFGIIRSGAFFIHNPKRFEVTDSNINILEGEGFRVTMRGDVLFRNVYFNSSHNGAFLGMNVNLKETNIRKWIIFNSPVFENFGGGTLEINTTSYDLKLIDVFVKEICDCARMDSVFASTDQLEEFQCLNEGLYVKYHDFKSNNCSLLTNNATVVILVCVVLIMVLIIGMALWCYFKKTYKCDRYGSKKDKMKKLSMIVPDGRTYRETELHVIVERTDLLTTDL